MMKKVILVPFTKDHISLTFEWVSNLELRQSFLMRGEPTREGNQAHWEQVLADSTQRVYAIFWGNKHIGNCGLKNIKLKKEGELWIYIGEPKMRGKGIGKQSTQSLLDKGFGMNLKVIYLHVGRANTVARNLYKALGFKEVSVLVGEWIGREVLRMELK